VRLLLLGEDVDVTARSRQLLPIRVQRATTAGSGQCQEQFLQLGLGKWRRTACAASGNAVAQTRCDDLEPGTVKCDRGFAELSGAALTAGALERKTKELIALAIGVVAGCDGCIASHAQAAARAGATKEEAAEAIGVTFLMHSGPATIYGARAYDAFSEFADAQADTGSGS
jgi:AhpD family alkylhydroperoxidase